MTTSDVTQLAAETFPEETFPASGRSDFRVYFEPKVHEAISAHASEDTRVEICGVVVGNWLQDKNGPFARITDFIRCDNAASKDTEVTFTHESWAQINEEMDSKHADKRIIGWYHSHPDFGIFLSDRDMFIQEHFFSGPGQVAYVVDPVRKLKGVFEWRQGKAELMEQYWAGDTVILSSAAKSPEPAKPALTDTLAATSSSAPAFDETESPFSFATILLSMLAIFLVGMLFGEWRSSRTERYLAEGAVAHYGLWNIMQYGRSEQLEAVQKDVDRIFEAVTQVSDELAPKFEGKERVQLRKQFQKIRKALASTGDNLSTISSRYSVPPEQRAVMAQVIMSHLGALSGVDQRQTLPVPIPIELPKLPKKKAAETDEGQPPESAPKKTAPKDNTTDDKEPKTATPNPENGE